jgi:hypothetical protein
LPRRRCPAGNKRGGPFSATISAAPATHVAATRQTSTNQWRKSTARAARTQTRHNCACAKRWTLQPHTSTAPPARHLTRANTRHTMKKTMRKSRRRVDRGATRVHECGKALAATKHTQTTTQRRCAARGAANEHAERRPASTHTHAAEHTNTRK